ncbi:MAG: hypothetical protein IKN65_00740 [Clostridia bacterium]|nr:hypothetical protein [Bacilli bacterium]MBR3672810.1 hypothetical protein [Clostridia bacterium]
MNNGIQPTVELATANNGYAYPVVYGNGGYGNGGFFGGDGIWAIVLLALLFNNGGWGGFGGGNNNDFAWLSNGQKDIMTNTNNGFDTLHLSNQLEGNRDAINGISNQICNSTADITSAVNNGFYGLNTSFLNCCCENRLATADLKSTIISENCADREALSNGIRDIIASQTAGTQRVLDQLCQDKIDEKNEKIADLQRQLSMADLKASQIAQNAFISQGFADEVDALYNRLSNCPVPSTPVYGRTPIFTCNNGCGCGMGTSSQFI